MGIEEKLEIMLREIGCESNKPFIHIKRSADEWGSIFEDEYFIPIQKELLKRDFEFTEEREQEVNETIGEVLMASDINSCDYQKDLQVSYSAFIGTKGLAVHIKDEGNGFNYNMALQHAKNFKAANKEILNWMQEDGARTFYKQLGKVDGAPGLVLLLRFAQDFHYNTKGNEVIFKFDLKK